MSVQIKLTAVERTILKMVVSDFVSQKKPTSQRQLFIKFQDPEAVESLISRSLLMDLNRQSVSPNLLTFELCGDEQALLLARTSLETVLLALRELYLQTEEDKQITPAEIESKAKELGRPVTQDTTWLGLYIIQNFVGVLKSSSGYAERGDFNWVVIGHDVLKLKQVEKVWGSRVAQQLEYFAQRESTFRPSTSFGFEADADVFNPDRPKESGLLIFISHSSKDADIAVRLIELLRSALGLTDEQIRCTSVEGFQLPGGVNTDEVLKAEVRNSRGFIGLITPNSMNSAYVLFELGARWGAGLHMVPLLGGVGPEALAGPLKPINGLSATNEAHLHQLVHELATLLQIPLQSPASYTRYLRKLIGEVQAQSQHSTASNKGQTSGATGERSGSRKIDSLTRERLIEVATGFVWRKQLPKWTVIVEGRELPVRPLVLESVGALPNDSTTSNAATAKLKSLGFEIRYNGRKA